MRNYRPNIAALLCFAVLAASCSPPGGPVVVAQSPPMPVVVPVVPTPAPVVPTPTPEPTPKPGITIPAETPIGKRLIATFCPPADLENATTTWRFFEVSKDGWIRPTEAVDALIEGDRAILWATAGNYRAEVICAGQVFTADFTVGDPKPPEPAKPLSELAGKDAAALAAIYTELAAAADKYGTVRVFTAVAAAKLAPFAANPATIEVAKRLAVLGAPDDPLDGPQLKALLAAVVTDLGAPGPVPTPNPSTATAAVYVYEKDAGPIPIGVHTALNRLNREKNIRATLFEEDTTDGTGDTPEQYKAAKAAAQQAGLPALVVLAGASVVKVVPKPATEQAVMEAVQ